MKKYFLISSVVLITSCGGGGGSSSVSSVSSSSLSVSSQSSSAPSSAAPSSSLPSSSSSISSNSQSSSVLSTATSSSTASSSSIASSSQSSTSSLTAYDGTYCGEFTALNDGVQGNNYKFLAPEGQCFGIVKDNSVRKTIPFEVDLSGAYEGVSVAQTLKIAQVNNRYMSIAMEFSNTGTKAYCGFSNNSGIYFYGEDNQLLPSPKSQNWLTGSIYGISSTYNQCLGPGDTFVLTDRYRLPHPVLLVHEGMTMDASVFELIARAEAPIGGYGGSERLESRVPDLLPIELKMSRFQVYPKISATFTNTTGKHIKLMQDFHLISYFDKDGYFINTDYLYLSEALGREPNDADYIIEAGENFTLIKNISDLATISPGTASKVSVQLDFVLVD